MQAYGKSFSAAYNEHWARFSRSIAPRIIEWLSDAGLAPNTDASAEERPRVIDLCCGAGHFAAALCDAGYAVHGIDLSEHMIGWTRTNCAEHIDAGNLELSVQDASAYAVPKPADAVVSLFDSLNHLSDMAALRNCFEASARAVRTGGLIAFDLNTATGIKARWRNISVEERDEVVLISRGMYLEDERRGYLSLSGFSRAEDGRYDRFGETVFNTVYTFEEVATALSACGWRNVGARQFPDLAEPAADPDSESRIFVHAVRQG